MFYLRKDFIGAISDQLYPSNFIIPIDTHYISTEKRTAIASDVEVRAAVTFDIMHQPILVRTQKVLHLALFFIYFCGIKNIIQAYAL